MLLLHLEVSVVANIAVLDMIQQSMACIEVISEITQEVKVGGQGDIVLTGMSGSIQSTESTGIREADMKTQRGRLVRGL